MRRPVAVLLLLLAAPPTRAAAGLATVGRDLVITREVKGRVVAVASDIRVEARVAGDVVVWGGDLSFGPAGSVAGNVWVLGGEILAPAERPLPVAGSVSTPGSLLKLYLSETEKAPWDEGTRASVFRGLRLITLSIWLLGALLLLYFFGSAFVRAADRAERDWSGSLLAGVLGVLSLFLAAAAALALLPSTLSVPIALTLAAVAVAAKVFGMAALFLLLGQRLLKSVAPPKRPSALAAGFLLLAAVSLLPVVGPLLWSAASIAAVGIAFASRFGAPRFRVALG